MYDVNVEESGAQGSSALDEELDIINLMICLARSSISPALPFECAFASAFRIALQENVETVVCRSVVIVLDAAFVPGTPASDFIFSNQDLAVDIASDEGTDSLSSY